MIIYLAKISIVRKKKEAVGVQALNRPPRLKGVVAKAKYVPPVNWDVITYETYVTGEDDEAAMADKYTLWTIFKGKNLSGKKEDYEIVKIERLREAGVTVDHYGPHPPTIEVLKSWPNPWPGDPDFDKSKHGYKPEKVVIVGREVPKYNFPPIKLSK